ncbi:MAG: transcription/translation regulatory transformer protein RfaH [Thiotrichaceae bacterium]
MEEKDKKSWWLVTTKARKEEYAEHNLINQGYETYRPLAKRLRKRRGVEKTVIESLFPRYIFIHLDQENDNWAPIRSTFGVHNIVSFGNKPARVPDRIIQALMDEQDLLAERAIDLDRYKKGDLVRIDEDGAFKGMEGIFQNYDSEQRSLVLLDILSTETILTISPAEISATS